MNTGLNRVGNECFYTKDNVSSYFVKKLDDIVNISSYDNIIEPSAGNGSFLRALVCIDIKNTTAYDISPGRCDIKQLDYLTLDTSMIIGKTLVVGNPPFGKNSCLAVKFIKKSCIYADTIAFILPKSFKKQSMNRAFPLNFHCIYEEDVSSNSFTILDKSVDVPCSFFIYQKKNYNRFIPEDQVLNSNFKFLKKDEISDYRNIIAFRRVGANAGKFYTNGVENMSIQSNYFLRYHKQVDLNKCVFKDNNTVGAKSISKRELVQQLNSIVNK